MLLLVAVSKRRYVVVKPDNYQSIDVLEGTQLKPGTVIRGQLVYGPATYKQCAISIIGCAQK